MYCSTTDVAQRLEMASLPATNVERLIVAATERIERETGRVFTRTPAEGFETRTFLTERSRLAPVDDLLEINSLTLGGTALDTDDLYLMPLGKTPTTWLEYRASYLWPPRGFLEISGAWGYSVATPIEIWDACVIWVAHAVQRVVTGYQDASADPTSGSLVFAQPMPPEVRRIIDQYRKTVL
jgi:hypothetical protein